MKNNVIMDNRKYIKNENKCILTSQHDLYAIFLCTDTKLASQLLCSFA